MLPFLRYYIQLTENKYSKNYDFVPLPSRYRFQVIVAHGDTPSIILTLPSLIVPHRSTLIDDKR
jgi:hypothetical protein